MVASHRPARPQRIVVKANRSPRPKPARTHYCVICEAELASDHGIGDLVCSCHGRRPYNPRHDTRLANHVLSLLANAYPEPLNLLRALGTDDRWAVHDAVNFWRGQGFPIVGVLHVGYRLGSQP
jgi:hypothetical protein